MLQAVVRPFGTLRSWAICGELSARQVAVGPREAGGNHFEHASPESFARENRKRARSIQIFIHMRVTLLSDTADPTHASCNTRNATTVQRYGRSSRAGHRLNRAERAVSGLSEASTPIARAGAQEPPG